MVGTSNGCIQIDGCICGRMGHPSGCIRRTDTLRSYVLSSAKKLRSDCRRRSGQSSRDKKRTTGSPDNGTRPTCMGHQFRHNNQPLQLSPLTRDVVFIQRTLPDKVCTSLPLQNMHTSDDHEKAAFRIAYVRTFRFFDDVVKPKKTDHPLLRTYT